MSDQPTNDVETKPADSTEVNTPAESATPTEQEPASDDKLSARKKEGAQFIEAFGEQDGSLYFAKGLSFEAAQVQFTKKLREENEALKQKLSARRGDGVDEPVDFSADEDPSRKKAKKGLAAVVKRAGT